MKLTTLLAILLPAAALAAPAPEPELATADGLLPDAAKIEKRAVVGTVAVDGLRYRTCPRTSCTAVGQYARGTRITLVCFVDSGTTVVNGDPRWARLSNGYYVAFGGTNAATNYIDFPGQSFPVYQLGVTRITCLAVGTIPRC
jgi:hypothetical protein